MVSISSSNRSMRYGSTLPIANRSMMPPRTQYSPGDSTCCTWLYPASVICSRSFARSSFSPRFRKKVNAARYSTGGSGYSAVVTGTTSTSQAPAAHMMQRRQPFGDQVLVRREMVIGQGLPVRQQMHAQAGREERDLLDQPLRFQRIGGDHDQRGMPAAYCASASASDEPVSRV